MNRICPKCGDVVSYNSYFGSWICTKCGHELEADTVLSRMRPVQLDETGAMALALAAEVSDLKQQLAVAVERAERAEVKMNSLIGSIQRVRPCELCQHHGQKWDTICSLCQVEEGYRPRFSLRK